MQQHRLKFAEELVGDILGGEKNVTVRYDNERDIRPGHEVALMTPGGEQFTTATVEIVVTGPIETVANAIEEFDWNYPHTDAEELAEELEKHYDVPFDTTVWVEAFKFEVKE